MGENICKWSNWQRINLQNIQAAHAAQYQKKTQPNTNNLMSLHLLKTWIDNESSQIQEVDFGSRIY